MSYSCIRDAIISNFEAVSSKRSEAQLIDYGVVYCDAISTDKVVDERPTGGVKESKLLSDGLP